MDLRVKEAYRSLAFLEWTIYELLSCISEVLGICQKFGLT